VEIKPEIACILPDNFVLEALLFGTIICAQTHFVDRGGGRCLGMMELARGGVMADGGGVDVAWEGAGEWA